LPLQLQAEKSGIQMVDERNKRGRPPKKPKLPEQESKERELLQAKILSQTQQGQVPETDRAEVGEHPPSE
jgi:hypothetical protein